MTENDKMLVLINETINSINKVRYSIYEQQWEHAETLFHALEALYELKYNIESEGE